MTKDSAPGKPDKSRVVLWYGPVALAGALFFLTNNGLAIWDRLQPTEIFVEASKKFVMDVKPDAAKIVITAKFLLADSAKAAAAGIDKKVDDFSSFAASLPLSKLAVLPLTINQEVVPVGEKFARSYTASQVIEITVQDFRLIEKIIGQAIIIEIGNIAETEFFLTSDNEIRKNLRESSIKMVNEEATAKAKELGRTLDRLADFSENTSYYNYSSTDDLAEIISEMDGNSQKQAPAADQIYETESADAPSAPANAGSKNVPTLKLYQSVSVKYQTK